MNLILKLTFFAITTAPLGAACSLKGCYDVTERSHRQVTEGTLADSEDFFNDTEMLSTSFPTREEADSEDREDVNDSNGGNQSPEDNEDQDDSNDNIQDNEGPDQDDDECFSAMNIVEVYGKGTIPMDALEIGDYVLKSNEKFSRVYSFCHKQENLEATFLQIHTTSSWSPLEVSSKHMVFLDRMGRMVPADSVKVGDTLTSYKVHDIKIVKRLGVYAPLTESGDIMVGKILASSYVAVYDESPLPFVNQHNLAHIIFAPQRIACYFFFKVCEMEKYTEEGYSEWTAAFIQFVIILKDFSPTIRMVVTLFAMPTFFFVYTLEQLLLLHSTRLVIILFPVVLFIIGKKTLVVLRKKEKIL